MLGLKTDTRFYEQARETYACLLNHARDPGFYKQGGVPDSFDGRFDLLVLHSFLIIQRMMNEGADGQAFNQDLFDIFFADMDQTLREMGIGDTGVPKHMKKMMKAFNGRLHAYQESLDGIGYISDDVLKRNLYGTLDTVPDCEIKKMNAYVKDVLKILSDLETYEIISGQFAARSLPKLQA